MNSMILLNAMEHIDERYILSAQNRLGYFTEAAKSRARPVKRLFTVALAAALALLCTLAAAMAVSPEFREAVISLFQLGEVEQVPDVPESGYEVKQVTIGGQVSAQYVRTDGYWQSDGETLLRQWDNGKDRYWDLIDGQLVEVGTDPRETVARLRWGDVDFTITLHTFVYKGLLYTVDAAGNYSELGDGLGDNLLSIAPDRLGSRTDVVVLRGASYANGEHRWSWICDLKTGEVQDVLAGCGIEELAFQHVQFAEDLKHAIVRAGDGFMGTPYLVDLENKICTPLSQLMGLEVGSDVGSYEVFFSGDHTVVLEMPPVWRPEPTSVWTYHIPSGMVTPTVTDETGLLDIFTASSEFTHLATKRDEDGHLIIIDLSDGKQVKLEGVTFPTDQRFLIANASHTKLLWAEWNEDSYDRLGVIDLETGEFTAFEREGLDPRLNENFSWLGDDRVVTTIDLHTGEEYVPGEEEYYLCVYEF